jgi:phospholipase C
MRESLATPCAASILRAGPTIAKGRKMAKRVEHLNTYDRLTWCKRLGTIAATTTIVATSFALPSMASEPETTTPIKHVIVIFQENVSFDHYFATYPFAANSTAGEPVFEATSDSPQP